MSGTLATIAGLASAVTTLFGGSPVTIGTVSLQGYEIPEKVTFGGTQRLTVHKLPGGVRVIDAMGRDDMPLGWSGILQGGTAVSRAQEIDQLRIAGGQVQLVWGSFSRTVVVASFECDYEKAYWMPYRISCEVLSVASGPTAGATPSLLSSVNSDIASATGIDISAAYSTVTSGLATVQSALAPVTALLGGSPAVATALGNITGVANSVTLGIGTAGAAINAGAATISNLPSLTTASGDLAGLSAIGGFVKRAAANLTSA